MKRILMFVDAHAVRYQVHETDAVKDFHQSRRMFCIKDNALHIAPKGVTYSHAVWFENEGWMTKDSCTFMDEHVRGFINKQGDVYFYLGYDFRITPEAKEIFFSFLSQLAKELGLSPTAVIYGGLVRQPEGGEWPGAVRYGTIKEYIGS